MVTKLPLGAVSISFDKIFQKKKEKRKKVTE
jgi:hypothetical protein